MAINLVREFISFERGKDPKSILGIGIHHPRVFANKKELVDYIILASPDIFDGEIPKDILNADSYVLKESCFDKICEFLKEKGMKFYRDSGKESDNWEFSDSHTMSWWPEAVKERLIDK